MLLLKIHGYKHFDSINFYLLETNEYGQLINQFSPPHGSSNTYRLLKHIFASRTTFEATIDFPYYFIIDTDEETEKLIKFLCSYKIKIKSNELDKLYELPSDKIIERLSVSIIADNLKK